ncbi:MAG: choice-of-anchor D domain-containing protein [Ignavibacteriaceae bacterium]|jgi:hypothetical protein|nr:MAG: Cytochrome c554 [Chlorobi bacterium OLB4]MBW7855353.1 choice-of-anchor D domain-containing protein [Ignavibacteria bacterium]MEB2329482.1 choice-of-anchor D domain-containing protein [Ignavibacteriaceae bacterium]OQY76922.1 MAG: hypothetical protein B6D43_08435 [Ignavibacteriales bacterium UTCHB1]
MRKTVLSVIFLFSCLSNVNSQTIIASYPFPNYSRYNSFYGLTEVNDTLWVGTSNGGYLYKITKTGQIVDSIATGVTFNQGLAWDGSGFWVARNYTSQSWRFFKLNMNGQKTDSISIPNLLGTTGLGLSGLSIEGSGMWFAVYHPDYTSYPNGYAFKIDLSTRQITDTIPLRGRQVTGISVKGVGDSIVYVNDYFHTSPDPDPERFYIYSRSTGDTVLSFPSPDPDGNCSPRGIHWDGNYLYLIADRIGNNQFLYRELFVYDLSGQGNPQITTNPNSLNFGNTVIGSPSNLQISIENTGTADLIISDFSFYGSNFSIAPNNLPDTIAPTQSEIYDVTFNPSTFGNVTDTLKITSNDGATPVKRIILTGRGVYNGAYISSLQSYINWSDRRTGSLCGGYLDISNQGSQPLVINDINFNSGNFWFDTINNNFPIQIDTQKTRTMRIWFNPTTGSVFSDTATVVSNAVNSSQLKIPLSGSGNNQQIPRGNIMWETYIPVNPMTSSQEFKPVSMRQIDDINGDGINDVIIPTRNYWVIAYNGNSSVTADTLWKFNTYKSQFNAGSVSDFFNAMQIRSDVNGDGISDVVVGCSGGNEHVYTICGRTGVLIWGYGDSVNYSNGDINGVRVDKDFNNDGIADVLVSASGEANNTGRRSVICLNGINGSEIFVSQQSSNFLYDVQTIPLGGAVSLVNNSGPYSVNGFSNTGQALWSYATSGATSGLNLIPDINNDGQPEIVGFSGFNGFVFAITSDAGAQLWAQNYGNSVFGVPIILNDLDGNGFVDMTFQGLNSLYRVNSNNGNQIWSNSLDGNYIHGVAVGSDVSGDGIPDIAAGTQAGNFYIVKGDSGTILFNYSFGSGSSYTVQKIAALNSIDGNFTTEFVAGNRQGRLICFAGGPDGISGLNQSEVIIPDEFSLSQNFPNPFNPFTKISFSLPVESNVKLVVFDALGREMVKLVNQKLQAGAYDYEFNGTNFASGVYFYRIEADDFVQTKRMVLLK